MKKRMGQKLLLLVMVLCIGLLPAAGCSSSGGNMDKDGNITLNFWSIYPEGDVNYDWTLSVIKAFAFLE